MEQHQNNLQITFVIYILILVNLKLQRFKQIFPNQYHGKFLSYSTQYIAQQSFIIQRNCKLFHKLMNSSYKQNNDEIIFVEVKKIVKRLLSYPIITILSTILFTIMDIETFFNVNEAFKVQQVGPCYHYGNSLTFLLISPRVVSKKNFLEEILKNKNFSKSINSIIRS
ncbi:unnamed protein product [Paramecium sonneborni]|uniref:Uncharacterized protein n=1 Tax=Paramecium sonneborni TaxID=65129 RepID=A0A8S1R5B7_9CILI|nr:unnamed protein product [Paramecium sonneborni]